MKQVFPPENEPWPSITHCYEWHGYYIEVQMTIFGGRRITARETGSEDYEFNWCAGDNPAHAAVLIGLAQKVLSDGIKAPFQSKRKPYFKCNEFLEFLYKCAPFKPYSQFLFDCQSIVKPTLQSTDK